MTSPKPFAIVLLWLAALAGCGSGSGPDRIPVSGTVSYRGQPVAQGEIRFQPAEGTKTSPSGATIKDGQYKVTARGGVPTGKFRVVITAFRPDPRPVTQKHMGGIAGGKPLLQYLPPKYNDKSELEITIAPDKNEIVENFDLK